MPNIHLMINGLKYTTRDGTHPDDEAYLEQVRGQLNLKLIVLGFVSAQIHLKFVPHD